MNLKKARTVLLALLGALFLCLLLAALLGSTALGLLSVALLLAFMGFSFSQWRCPHCGEFLGWIPGKGIPFCPYCHQRLDDTRKE